MSFEPVIAIVPAMVITGSNDIFYAAQPLVIMAPEHARTVAGGFTKAEAKHFLQQHATLPMSKFSRENIERRLKVTYKERYANAGPDAPVYAVQKAGDLLIAVIGGAGKHSAFVPTFGATKAVTRALRTANGQLAQSMADFRRG